MRWRTLLALAAGVLAGGSFEYECEPFQGPLSRATNGSTCHGSPRWSAPGRFPLVDPRSQTVGCPSRSCAMAA